MLENMWASLSRAGDHWMPDARVDPDVDGKYNMSLRLHTPISSDMWEHVRGYIKAYARASGWSLDRVRKRPTYVEFRGIYRDPPKKNPKHRRASRGTDERNRPGPAA